jgi:hypothetical protein
MKGASSSLRQRGQFLVSFDTALRYLRIVLRDNPVRRSISRIGR